MDIREREDAVARQDADVVGQRAEKGPVEDARRGLDRAVVESEPNRVEALAGEKGRIVGVESQLRRQVRGALGDHVEAVEDHHATGRVGDPAPNVVERRDRRGTRRRARRRGEGHGSQKRQRCGAAHRT